MAPHILGPRGGVVVVKTIDVSIDAMMRGQLRFLQESGLSPMTIIAADTGLLEDIAVREGVRTEHVPFRRDPSPFHDVVALVTLVRLLIELRPSLIIYGTPKAALLGAVAAWLTRVPARLQILHGLRLDTTTGWKRRVLLLFERITLRLSTKTIAVSRGLAAHCRDVGLVSSPIEVLGRGSISGVDVDRFARIRSQTDKHALQREWGVTARQVAGFVGRIQPDKGIDSLVAAVALLRGRGRDIELVLVGPDDGIDDLDRSTQAALGEGWIHVPGPVDDSGPTLASLDVLCLPSRREGLGMVVLEAWASSTPVVVSDVPALAHLVADGVNGHVARVDDAVDLATAIEAALGHAGDVTAAGLDAVTAHFSQRTVWKRHLDEFASLSNDVR